MARYNLIIDKEYDFKLNNKYTDKRSVLNENIEKYFKNNEVGIAIEKSKNYISIHIKNIVKSSI